MEKKPTISILKHPLNIKIHALIFKLFLFYFTSDMH